MKKITTLKEMTQQILQTSWPRLDDEERGIGFQKDEDRCILSKFGDDMSFQMVGMHNGSLEIELHDQRDVYPLKLKNLTRFQEALELYLNEA